MGNPIASTSGKGNLYLLGVSVTHALSTPIHNHIAKSLSKPWIFSSLECPTVSDMVSVFYQPTFAGAVITLPYKQSVIPYLTGLDEHAVAIGAVNNVYLTPEGKLRGTNTDWEGVKGCLIGGDKDGKGRGKPALVIGAGGASRAAIYALSAELGCSTIYIINRDVGEVKQLLLDAQKYSSGKVNLIHVTSVLQARSLPSPFYVVGTVPDFAPKTESEIEMRNILEVFLEREEKGVILDMCYKPRNTRTLKLARKMGWVCVDGTGVIGYQIETQWSLWTRENISISKEDAWEVLNKAAEESTAINF